MIYKLRKLSTTYAESLLRIYGQLKADDMVLCGNRLARINPEFYFSGLRDNIPETITFCQRRGKETIGEAIARLTESKQSVFLLPLEFKDHVVDCDRTKRLYVFLNKQEPMVVFGRMMANCAEPQYPRFKQPEDYPKTCYVGPNVHIADTVTIGENVKLIGNIFIYDDVRIGHNVVIKPNTVIGGEGFEKDYDPTFDRTNHWPHMGGVIIEDNVQIGSCVCIDRGMFKDTIIRRGVQLDNLIHVAHSVEIGENTRVVASTMCAGSTTIGARSWIATSIIKNGLTLGDDCFIGLGSVVVRNIPAGKLAFGVPAQIRN